MPRLQENERIQALLQLAAGVSVADVARQFNCHRNTIIKLRRRYHQNGSVRDRPRSGRPKVTTARQDRPLTLTNLRHRFQTATSTERQLGVSRDTVLNRLRANANRRQKSSYKTLQICNFYFSPLRYSHVKQCSDNYQISIKSKTSCSQYIFAHFDTKFAYIVLVHTFFFV